MLTSSVLYEIVTKMSVVFPDATGYGMNQILGGSVIYPN